LRRWEQKSRVDYPVYSTGFRAFIEGFIAKTSAG
jgi:hypothetical protein